MGGRVVAMIPARAGSKGLPGKNVKELCGRPLLDYSIRPALECPLVSNVYVNSEDDGYLSLAERLGARRYRRSGELATDTAAMGPVVQSFYRELLDAGHQYDAILVMYPVYPLRTAGEIGRFITAFFEAGGDRPMIGLKPAKTHPFLSYTQDSDGGIHQVVDFDIDVYYRRQTYPECFEITYYVCIVPTAGMETLNSQLQDSRTIGYRVDPERAIDIDGPDDFRAAERSLNNAARSELSIKH